MFNSRFHIIFWISILNSKTRMLKWIFKLAFKQYLVMRIFPWLLFYEGLLSHNLYWDSSRVFWILNNMRFSSLLGFHYRSSPLIKIAVLSPGQQIETIDSIVPGRLVPLILIPKPSFGQLRVLASDDKSL